MKGGVFFSIHSFRSWQFPALYTHTTKNSGGGFVNETGKKQAKTARKQHPDGRQFTRKYDVFPVKFP